MRDIQSGVAAKRGGWFGDCNFVAVTGRFTMGVTQLKLKKEEGAGAVIWPNMNEDAAAFCRTLPVRFAEKSRTPPRLIFCKIDLASLPHLRIPSRCACDDDDRAKLSAFVRIHTLSDDC
jgi:hypothetical protein